MKSKTLLCFFERKSAGAFFAQKGYDRWLLMPQYFSLAELEAFADDSCWRKFGCQGPFVVHKQIPAGVQWYRVKL